MQNQEGKEWTFSFCFRSKENKNANCGILNTFFFFSFSPPTAVIHARLSKFLYNSPARLHIKLAAYSLIIARWRGKH